MSATIVITGANRGLGLELARQYAADGWRVEATARSSSQALDALRQELPGRVRIHELDVTDAADISRFAEVLGGAPVDVLVNNAGYMGRVPFAAGGLEHQRFGNSDFEDWELVFRINVIGPMRMSEALVENVASSSQRKIVTFTSMLGSIELNTIGGLYPYRASKAAVNAMMKSMSIDLAPRGILAVAMHPGWVKTDMGGPGADIDEATSIRGVRAVIAGLDASRLGRVLAFDGSVLPY